jgi:integrase
MTFSKAADSFFADYGIRHRPKSIVYMKYCIKHFKEHVGNMLLVEIGTETVVSYQNCRLAEKASTNTVNEEVMVLLQILREMGDVLRARMKRDKTLKLSYSEFEGKALTSEEVGKLYDAARVPEADPDGKQDLKDTRSRMILPSIALALNATLRDSEIRTLTWDRINFLKGILTVGRSKTAAGTGRTIPINTELRQILEDYRLWYEEKIGPASPEQYVFPFGKNHKWDPNRPISTLKTSWENVRTKAGVTARFHDLRHTAITNLCESGAPEATIMAIAGHVSRKMLERYAHIRTESKREAVEAIVSRREKAPPAAAEASQQGASLA